MLKFIYLLKKKSKRFGVIRSPSSVDLILIIFTVILLYYFRNISRSYFDLAQEREEVEENFGNHSTMYLLLLFLNSIFVEFEFENSNVFPLRYLVILVYIWLYSYLILLQHTHTLQSGLKQPEASVSCQICAPLYAATVQSTRSGIILIQRSF